MHQIYQTKGIILDKKDYGEADRLFFVFTEKFGMIRAMATGVRQLKSKMRCNLGLFSQGEFCLIRARDSWRIIDAQETWNIGRLSDGENLDKKLSLISKISTFLRRMLKGEEANDFIWKEIQGLLNWLSQSQVQGLSESQVEGQGASSFSDLETATISRILHNLGYMENIPQEKRALVDAINRAMKESML